MPDNNHSTGTLAGAHEAEAILVLLALAPLADRWSFRILREVFTGTHRYGELQRRLGISRNILAERLSLLVELELLRRVRYRTEPDWYEYRLTQRAADLYPAAVAFHDWVENYFGDLGHSAFVIRPHRCGLSGRPILICSACKEPIVFKLDEDG